jgi:hypothetical protein
VEDDDMAREFEVTWEGEMPATPQEVREAFTKHTRGRLWEIAYEPRVCGAEPGRTGVPDRPPSIGPAGVV